MKAKTKRNLLKAPFVLFVRAPLIFPFYALGIIGEFAYNIGERLDQYLPGFER